MNGEKWARLAWKEFLGRPLAICSELDYGMNTFCVAVTEPLVTLTI